MRIAQLEEAITHPSDEDTTAELLYILEASANTTHVSKTHGKMRKTTGTLTKSANSKHHPITHTGPIKITQNKTPVTLPAAHSPIIRGIPLSVLDLKRYGHVTFTPHCTIIHAPQRNRNPILTATCGSGPNVMDKPV